MIKSLKKIGNIYNKLEEYVLVGSLIITVLLIFYQVIMRYVFNNSSYWTEELARYIFMWQIWLGTSIGFRDNKHIKIELLTGKLKGKVKLLFFILSNLLLMVFCIFLVVEGKIFLDKIIFLKMETPALRIPFFLVYASLPVSSFVVCVRILVNLINEFKLFFSPSVKAKRSDA